MAKQFQGCRLNDQNTVSFLNWLRQVTSARKAKNVHALSSLSAPLNIRPLLCWVVLVAVISRPFEPHYVLSTA